ncbi:WD40-repeat-containing domain protein [Entophlyctis helioformis]|nr:WD40-repeat-containing domain protein [Entophlyctis helioformis]
MSSLADLPLMISSFDSLPLQLKNYLLAELLRRCSMPSLQFVSSLVLPSLRRDFVAELPVELSYQILDYLDLRTLARCQRVSRDWRHVLDGEGAEVAIWKRRLVSEGFADEAEIAEAVAKHNAALPLAQQQELQLKMQQQQLQASSFSLSSSMLAQTQAQAQAQTSKSLTTRPSFSFQRPSANRAFSYRQSSSSLNSGGSGFYGVGNTRTVFRGLYKNLYRRHHLIRRNWFQGRYRHISFPGHGPNVVTCLQFDTDKIVSGSDDQTIRIYNPSTGALVRSLEGHEGGVWALQYWQNALVSGSTDRTVRVWDMDTGECTQIFDGHTSTVRCLIIVVPDSASGSSSGSSSGPAGGSRSRSRTSPVDKDDQLDYPVIITGSRDTTIRVWRLPDPSVDPRWSPAIAARYAERKAARAQARQQQMEQSAAHGAAAAEGANGATLPPSEPHATPSGAWSAAGSLWEPGRSLLSNDLIGGDTGAGADADEDDELDLSTNPYFMHVLTGHSNSVRAVAGHGNVLVSGSYDCTVRVWNIMSGECIHVFRGHREKVYTVGYSHELRRAVSGSMDASVKVWCTRTGVALFNLEGHTSLVGLLELSSQYIVSAAADATLRIWSPVTGACLSSLTGHAAAITCLHHDPKTNRIVSGSDGGIKIWELSSAGYGTPGSLGNASSVIPKSSPLSKQLAYTQGPDGPMPVHGRFVCDVVSHVQGVWRVRMDEKRLVCAVQREEGGTWFDVLDFSDIDGEAGTESAGSSLSGGGSVSDPMAVDDAEGDDAMAAGGAASGGAASGAAGLPTAHSNSAMMFGPMDP